MLLSLPRLLVRPSTAASSAPPAATWRRTGRRRAVALAATLVAALAAGPVVAAELRLVSRSTTSATAGGNRESRPAALSADGQVVLFRSFATDLVPGFVDGNGPDDPDVYLYDRRTGAVTLVSRKEGTTATGASRDSHAVALSADGQVVLFASRATDLVPGLIDPNGGAPDVFLYDRGTGAVTLVSRATSGPTTSGNGSSSPLALSANGQVVLFASLATDLVSGFVNANGSDPDVYLYDRGTGAVTLVSHRWSQPTEGGGGASFAVALSADGQVVIFQSRATDLVPGFVDGNGSDEPDAYLYDRGTEAVTLVSHRWDQPTEGGNGASVPVALSADGQVVLFWSQATNLGFLFQDGNAGAPDVFLYDRATGGRTLVSRAVGAPRHGANGESDAVALSADGQVVLFYSYATDLVSGFVDRNGAIEADVYLYDRGTGTVTLVSRATAGPTAGGDGGSYAAAVSADGRVVLFESFATDLVPGFSDGNGPDHEDVFLVDRATGTTRLLSHAAGGPLRARAARPTRGGDARSFAAGESPLSEDGGVAVFGSQATTLVPRFVDGSGAGGANVFLWVAPPGLVPRAGAAGGSAGTR